jgi:YD repeat-containing protein
MRWVRRGRHVWLGLGVVGASVAVLGTVGILRQQSRRSAGVAASFDFDDSQRLTRAVQPDGTIVTWKYDARGLPVEVAFPDGVTKAAYDANGNRIWIRDATGITEYYYDALDRLSAAVSRHSPWRLLLYTYDHTGSVSSAAVIDLDRLSALSQHRQAVEQMTPAADASGVARRDRECVVLTLRDTLLAAASASTPEWLEYRVSYERDLRGRVTGIGSPWGRVGFSYSSDEREVVRTLPSGVTSRFAFAGDGTLSLLVHESSDHTLIAEYRYGYDSSGRIVTIDERTPTGSVRSEFGWDSAGRLEHTRSSAGGTQRFAYDEHGRVRTIDSGRGAPESFAYDPQGRPTEAGGASYRWSRDGRLSEVLQGGATTQLQYDARGRLDAVLEAAGRTTYRWDSEGHLLSRSSGGKTRHTLSMLGMPSPLRIEEFGEDGKPDARFIHADVPLARIDREGRATFFLEGPDGEHRYRVDDRGTPTSVKRPDRVERPQLPPPPAFLAARPERFSMAVLRPPVVAPRLPSRADLRAAAQDRTGQFWDRVREGIERGAKLPLPSRDAIDAREAYWTTGEAERTDPYYRDLSGPMPVLDAGTYVRNFGLATGAMALTGVAAGLDLTQAIHPFAAAAGSGLVRGFRDRAIDGMESSVLSGLRTAAERVDAVASLLSLSQTFPDARLVNTTLTGRYEIYDPRGQRSLVQYAGSGSVTVPTHEYVGRVRLGDSRAGAASWYGSLRETFGLSVTANPRGIAEVIGEQVGSEAIESVVRRTAAGPARQASPGQTGDAGRPPGWAQDPFVKLDRQLGGVELGATARVEGRLGPISGAVYDAEHQAVVLLGDTDLSLPSVRAEDLALALKMAYAAEPIDPQFSLDPADAANPAGEWLKAVYLPEALLAHTSFGRTMFDADWLLKQYSFGVLVDEAGRQHALRNLMPGFTSVADLALARPDKGTDQPRWSRLWIVAEDVTLRREGSAVVFDTPRMAVRARRQVPDPKSPTGLRDVDTADDADAAAFAAMFSAHYDELAVESPALARVRELAKAVALAKWLRQQNVPLDLGWVDAMAARRVETVGLVSTLTSRWTAVTRTPYRSGAERGIRVATREVHLTGGVDLSVKPAYRPGGKAVATLGQRVAEMRQRAPDDNVFSGTDGTRPFSALVVPLAQDARHEQPSTRKVISDGSTHELNAAGRVERRTNSQGDTAYFAYDANSRLSGVRVTGPGGWQATGSRTPIGSVWTIPDARGNSFTVEYSPSGLIRRLTADGRTLAEYSLEASTGRLRITRDEVVETLGLDPDGRVHEYSLEWAGNAKPSSEARLAVEYDGAGRPQRVSGPGPRVTEFRYGAMASAGDAERLPLGEVRTLDTSADSAAVEIRVSSPFGEERRLETQTGSPLRVESSSGVRTDFEYSAGSLSRASVRRGSRSGELAFTDRQIRLLARPIGTDGTLARTSNSDETADVVWNLDNKRRPREVVLADGRRWAISYEQLPHGHPNPQQSGLRVTVVAR